MFHVKKNNVYLGLIIGLFFPLFGFSLVYGIFDLMVSSGMMDEAATGLRSQRMRTMTLIGICTNIYWIRKLNQPYTGQSLRGVVIGTMLLSLGWFILYYSELYATDY